MWPPLVPSRSASADMVREARPSSAIAAMASSSIRSWVTCPSRRRAVPATAAVPVPLFRPLRRARIRRARIRPVRTDPNRNLRRS
ncbi:hypothetical protein GCM10010497_62110 [Streptomyces cinereoruber]|uniref:Uncharacterized protein n=1 Tax=Streptomyces cinereoruber TaxID=67260 RepID=A0AAV4KSA2_9ACTN|nr:hypothetical protein GCM10010497_62110 [Streptomyces cinereoruber]